MITIAIVEDIKEIREGLQMLINYSAGFSCTEIFANGETALQQLPVNNTDVILMDINLPGISGIECVRRLKPLCPASQFIMSTVYEDDEHIFESLKAGATGYLLKKTPPAKLLEAITEVYEGGSPMNAQIARRVISSFQNTSIPAAEILTPREKEVLGLLAKGLRYKEIAVQLHVSMETIRSHARRIYEKLQVQSRTEAINKVYKRGG